MPVQTRQVMVMMKLSSCALVLAATVAWMMWNPVSGSSLWQLQRDSLAEYRLVDRLTTGSRTEMGCLLAAELFAESAAVDAVAFDSSTGSCSVLQCLMGHSGCRKCRHARNASLPGVWVRPLAGVPSNCWTTFQHHVDASLSFNRNWTEFVAGFGQGEDLNYWMGLQELHQVTLDCVSGGSCRVRWEFADWAGAWHWAENGDFSVANGSDKYRLRMGSVDPARSSVGQIPLDSVNSVNNRQFSTPDADNDISTDNCAQVFTAGWWFGWCTAFNPNGVHYSPPDAFNGRPSAMFYFYSGSAQPLSTQYSMKSFECLVLPMMG